MEEKFSVCISSCAYWNSVISKGLKLRVSWDFCKLWFNLGFPTPTPNLTFPISEKVRYQCRGKFHMYKLICQGVTCYLHWLGCFSVPECLGVLFCHLFLWCKHCLSHLWTSDRVGPSVTLDSCYYLWTLSFSVSVISWAFYSFSVVCIVLGAGFSTYLELCFVIFIIVLAHWCCAVSQSECRHWF